MPQAGSQSPSSLEARLQRLEDETEIRALLVAYGDMLDAKDCAGYAALFAADGEWVGQMGRARGPKAIEVMLANGLAKAPPALRDTKSLHLMTNFQITVDGDRAEAVSKLVWIVTDADGGPRISRVGHYLDRLLRENGRWKFARRMVMGDIPPNDPLAAQPKDIDP